MKHHITFMILVTLLMITSCNKIEIEKDYMVGKWSLRLEDERIISDGATWYTFHSDGFCQREVYNALAATGEDTSFSEGTWRVQKDVLGNHLLLIEFTYSDISYDSSEAFLITQKSKNELRLCPYEPMLDGGERYILTRCTH